MITLIMIVAVLLIFPDVLKKSDERYKEKRRISKNVVTRD